MGKESRLKNLIVKIESSKLESIKAQEYAAGYFDCLRDVMDEKISEFNKAMEIKYDSKVRLRVYEEILPTLKSIEETSTDVEQDAEHPSSRAKNFMDRVGI
jgi:hypothetical protein